MKIRHGFLIVLLSWLAAWPGMASDAVEKLEFRVIYRGVFSLGSDLEIADLSLETLASRGAAGLVETRLDVTSAAYPNVESLYPIRYRFRTWSTQDAGQLVGFETYEKSRKLRHRLYLRDGSDLGVQRLDVNAGVGRDEIARLDTGELPDAAVIVGDLLDRLGMLQRVRAQTLIESAQFSFPVTNGREQLTYRVKVEGLESVNIGPLVVPAWKVSFAGFHLNKHGEEEAAHRPAIIWLSQAPGHIPLRADSQHPIGVFRIELHPPSALQHLALTDR
ncbi:MAG: DUF3108 domain-containing protein [Gammaproteobacteria bacterium]|nr:DUF3108 domain-containing protein [Gammaproteobacteria bacterium]MCP5318322.1 DUF3108 domain-containing protein [Chromatiaceae bacterium]MCW5587728.1 DUF3108 domain-containing protein [Chromatiales bacterium]MCB1817395.1 DUF3108 domain-containing protein [Gammaproteobacteria bacterium]MCP5434935.1 DUF3108 domain-containing protein [Chromatiaceae bacterium]